MYIFPRIKCNSRSTKPNLKLKPTIHSGSNIGSACPKVRLMWCGLKVTSADILECKTRAGPNLKLLPSPAIQLHHSKYRWNSKWYWPELSPMLLILIFCNHHQHLKYQQIEITCLPSQNNEKVVLVVARRKGNYASSQSTAITAQRDETDGAVPGPQSSGKVIGKLFLFENW